MALTVTSTQTSNRFRRCDELNNFIRRKCIPVAREHCLGDNELVSTRCARLYRTFPSLVKEA